MSYITKDPTSSSDSWLGNTFLYYIAVKFHPSKWFLRHIISFPQSTLEKIPSLANVPFAELDMALGNPFDDIQVTRFLKN